MVAAARPGAILLIGGASTRMGSSKADLDWQGSPLATHMARVLVDALPDAPIVIVAGADQSPPPLPADVELVRDAVPGEGPMRGLLAGLDALDGRCEAAMVCAVDTPLLHPALIRALVGALRAEDDALVPVAHGHRHPLTAVYRTALRERIANLLGRGDRRMGLLVETTNARLLDEAALRALPVPGDPEGRTLGDVDPDLVGLRNANTPEEFQVLRGLAGRG